jgi:hypothetical protein
MDVHIAQGKQQQHLLTFVCRLVLHCLAALFLPLFLPSSVLAVLLVLAFSGLAPFSELWREPCLQLWGSRQVDGYGY